MKATKIFRLFKYSNELLSIFDRHPKFINIHFTASFSCQSFFFYFDCFGWWMTCQSSIQFYSHLTDYLRRDFLFNGTRDRIRSKSYFIEFDNTRWCCHSLPEIIDKIHITCSFWAIHSVPVVSIIIITILFDWTIIQITNVCVC